MHTHFEMLSVYIEYYIFNTFFFSFWHPLYISAFENNAPFAAQNLLLSVKINKTVKLNHSL